MIDAEDLEEAGWPPGSLYARLIAAARELEGRGIRDKAYLLKLLARDFPKPDPKVRRRQDPLPFAEAIEATCEEDETNIVAVRRTMRQLMRTPVIAAGAVMPDACPAGAAEATIPVGGAIAVEGAIVPAAHSADICCSLYATFFRSDEDPSHLLDCIQASTRFGPGGRSPDDLVPHPVIDEPVWDNRFLSGLRAHATMHMADQGDGNHFAFLGRMRVGPDLVATLSEAGHRDLSEPLHSEMKSSPGGETTEVLALVTHHGSRGLGAHVFKRGHKAAIRETARIAEGIPAAAAWLDIETSLGEEYWEALRYVGRWTRANHESIHARFLERSGADPVAAFGNEHNFVWRRGDLFLHGKGATPAWKDDSGRPLLGLIPLNMAEPILVTLGRDNSDYLSFAPHGAGRNRSRSAMMRDFRLSGGEVDEKRVKRTIADTTRGLDVRWWHGRADLTETPIAYKPAVQVREQIERFGLADVVGEIEPLGSLMAGDAGPRPWASRSEQLTPKQIRQMDHRAQRRKARQRRWEDEIEG